MPSEFPYDVFLSHSSKDKAVVQAVAERLRADELNGWLDDWGITKAEVAKRKSAPELQPSALSLQPFPDVPIKGSLPRFLYINWLRRVVENSYA